MSRQIPFLLLMLALFTWTGCVDVTFQEPMPQNRRNLNQFPRSWQGTWSNGDDLNIKIEADRFIDLDSEESFPLGEKIILRRFNGYLVLSKLTEDLGSWEVTLGKRTFDQIEIWSFDAEKIEDWQAIEGITVGQLPRQPEDSQTNYIIDANNPAFRSMIKENGIKSIGLLNRIQ